MQHIDELGIMLNSNDTDIAAITETWFPPQVHSSVFSILNYTVISKPRYHKQGSSVALYIKDSIQKKILTGVAVPEELELIWVWVRPKCLPRAVSVVYHPPACPHEALLSEHVPFISQP